MERISGSCRDYSVHKASYRALQTRDQASTLLTSFRQNVPVVEAEGRSAVCQGCPQALPATTPGRHWAELVRQPPTPLPSYLRLSVRRDCFNLLKHWNAVRFSQSFSQHPYILWVLEVTLCFYLNNDIINAIIYMSAPLAQEAACQSHNLKVLSLNLRKGRSLF